MTRIEFYGNLNKYKDIQDKNNELMHYGTIGQKWGVRKWQNYDGTFNEAGKERYFGKTSKPKTTEEEKVGSNKSNVKDYLKFRNKMLKQRTDSDLNKWYRDKMKDADKQLIKDAKRVDKQQMKMYKNQLKDFYDNPEDLVNDLDRMYRIGSNDKKKQKIGSWTEADQAKHMEDFRNWQEVGKNIGMLGGDVRSIYDSDEDYYDDNAKNIILKNSKLINKMEKAILKDNSEKYMKLRNSIEDDYEKDLTERFIQDKRNLDEYKNTLDDLNKSFKKKGINIYVNRYDDTDTNVYGEKDGRRSAFESDFVKHPENIKKYKENCEKVLNNYDKFNEELIDKLSDKYYNAYKNTWGYEAHPLTKEQFKKTFEKATGTLYPASNGNGATFEGEISYNPYGGPLKNYLFFDYDLLNKTFGYINEE